MQPGHDGARDRVADIRLPSDVSLLVLATEEVGEKLRREPIYFDVPYCSGRVGLDRDGGRSAPNACSGRQQTRPLQEVNTLCALAPDHVPYHGERSVSQRKKGEVLSAEEVGILVCLRWDADDR